MNVRTGMANYKCKFLGKQEVDGKVGFTVFFPGKLEDPSTVSSPSLATSTDFSHFVSSTHQRSYKLGCVVRMVVDSKRKAGQMTIGKTHPVYRNAWEVCVLKKSDPNEKIRAAHLM